MLARTVVAALVLAFLLAAPGRGSAQDVTYRTSTSVSFGSGLDRVVGFMARLGGGSLDSEQIETQYIKGRRMRTDTEESSSIVDLESGRMVFIDHQARTYTEFSFTDMAAAAQAMAQGADRAVRDAPADAGPAGPSDVEYTFDISVERSGERERILGYDSERFFMTVTLEGREVGGPDDARGSFVVLTDLWTSRTVPGQDAFEALTREHGEQFGGAAAGMAEALTAAFAQEPAQRAAFERAAEELATMEGMPVRTTTYMVVTGGQDFDRQAVLAQAQPAERQGGGGVSVGDAARGAIGGLLGRGRQAPQPEPEPEPEPDSGQVTLFKVVQELVEVSTAPIPESVFAVPEGYRRVQR